MPRAFFSLLAGEKGPVDALLGSAAGIKAGRRTGLTAALVGALVLLVLFFAPLAASILPYTIAAAILFVAGMMAAPLAEIDWKDPTEYAPAIVMALAMPLT